METEQQNLVSHDVNDSRLGPSIASESVRMSTGNSQQVETDKPDDIAKKAHSFIYREDVVTSNKTGSIGVVSEVAGDSDSESDITDDEDDDEDDDEKDEEDVEENVIHGNWNANNNGDGKENVGSYNCGALQADQVRVVWMDYTEPVQDIKDVTVVDRAFLHGDFVASASDPTGQVGVVVDVNISVDLLAPDGNSIKEISSKDLKRVRDFAVGDYVVHGPWLGRIDDVLDNVTVLFDDGSVCKVVHAEPSRLRPSSRNNLEEDAHFPYYPGQRVRASSSSVFKNSQWLFGLWKPKRLEGTVTKVTAGSVYVYWIASAGFGPDSSVTPLEQQNPKDLTLLSCFTHSNWQVGDWCLLPSLIQSSSIPLHKRISKLRLDGFTKTEVDHQREIGYESEDTQEESNENSASSDFVVESSPNGNEETAKKSASSSSSVPNEPVHDSWPLHRRKIRKAVIRKDKKLRKKEESFERALLIVNSRTRVDVAWQDGRLECGQEAKTLIPIENPGDHEFVSEQYVVEKAPDDADNAAEPRRVGVVKSVNAKERTACVRWLKPVARAEDPREFDKEEVVSVYELEGHPDYDYCYGDLVVRLSPVLVPTQASSTGNSFEEPTLQEDAKQDMKRCLGSKEVKNTFDHEANTYISDLSWVGNITGLKDGDIEVSWADGMVSTVGPQAIYVVGRDDDESVAAGSEVSDEAASWETIDGDNEMDALENAQEELPVENSTGMNYDAENDSGRNGALALPLVAIEFVARLASGIFSRGRKNEDSVRSDSRGENELQSQGPVNASEERVTFDDEPSLQNRNVLDDGSMESSEVKANHRLGEEISAVSNSDAPEALCSSKSEKSDDPAHHEGDACCFKRFDISQDPQDHYFLGTDGQNNKGRKWFKKVQQDWSILQNNLPDGIYVRAYEDRMDLLRAVIVGAYGTPYQDGLFFFDFHLRPEYPDVPPSAYYHSGGWRINPNLYEEGKVCLSLLNTWTGRGNEVWDPKSSSILQVLVSLQGLVLNSKPYFNEAGYDKQIGTAEGEKNSLAYNENTFLLNCKTMMYLLRRPPKDFEELIKEHFKRRGYYILKACDAYTKGFLIGSLANDASVSDEHAADSTSVGFKLMLAKILPRIFSSLSEIGAQCEGFNHLQQFQ